MRTPNWKHVIVIVSLVAGSITGVQLGHSTKRSLQSDNIPIASRPSSDLVHEGMLFRKEKGDLFPDVTIEYASGTMGHLSDFYGEGQLIILFWSPGCPGCLEQARLWKMSVVPNLKENVEVIVCLDFIDEPKLGEYSTLFENMELVFLDQTEIHLEHNLIFIPTIFNLDSDGAILHIQYGSPTAFDRDLVRNIMN